MENALSTIKLLPATRNELRDYSQKVKSEILSGHYDALEVAGMLKAMEELVKSLRADKDIKEAIETEADKYAEKTIEIGNFKITKSSRSTKDYAGIDPILEDLNVSLEQRKKMIKARQSVIDSGVNPETGETFAPVPKQTQTIISVTLK